MKREYIVFKVYAECPLLCGWLRLGSDKGVFELVDIKEMADFVYNIHSDTEENARVFYEVIRKSIIEFVYEMLFIECETDLDYKWLQSQEFFGQIMSMRLNEMILDKRINLLENG